MKGKGVSRQIPVVDNNGKILNGQERDAFLINKYHPELSEREGEILESMDDYWNRRGECCDKLGEEELREALCRMRNNKASGAVGMSVSFWKYVCEERANDIKSMYGQCLQFSYFPLVWKRAKMVWLPKGAGGVRPISLMPVSGRLFDKILNRRLQCRLESAAGLDYRQFGFRKGVGTVDAVAKLAGQIKEGREAGKHQLLVLLDISNAFNMAWAPVVSQELERAGIDKGFIKMCWSFMRNRFVQSGSVIRSIGKGCPQGSSLGPTLWLMVMEGWFRVIDRIEQSSMNKYRGKGLGTNVGVRMLTAQAYADDQVLLFRAESAKKLECMFRMVWEELNVWAKDVAVQYSAGKTEALFLPARGKIRPPVLTAGNLRIIPSAVVTYLGVILDAKLLFLEHAKSVRVKVGTVCVKIKGILRNRSLAAKEVVWLMYERAVKSAILYASEIWGGKALDSRVKKQLEASHRLLLLGMGRVYQTTSTEALQVVFGSPPVWLECVGRSKFYIEYDCRVNEGRAKESERVPPHQRITEVACGESPHVEEVDWQVWCDASVEGEKGAIGVWCVGTTTGEEVRDEWVEWGGKDPTSMEVAAIGKALGILRSLCKEREGAVVRSDSRQAIAALEDYESRSMAVVTTQRLLHDLRDSGIRVSIYWEDRRGSAGAVAADKIASGALWGTPGTEMVATITKRQVRSLMRSWVMEEWLRLWRNSSKGRELFEVCDMVGKGMLGMSKKALQLATGHGNFRAYLARFKIRNGGECECGLGAETAQHVRTVCMKPVREAARECFDPETPRWRLRGMNGRRDEDMVKRFEEFAEVVVSDDDFE
ncbi:uncharacterized protein LOC109545618 [Dendroctonus ponderosae]|uniref:uncharacterized protein LOC109545618 n=1 Tax=Dendroctonus ponderosae TaxID=77166 RepID=UPI002035B0C5|nr:uncharacterized protein LOC109545618 [Dendroctonus ponderosae]